MPDLWMDVDTALAEVPVNLFPLTDDTDFKSRETGITFDQAGMDLVFVFCSCAGAMSVTAVTPASTGDYAWVNQGEGYYSLQMPASGGASINNNTEGSGWFEGVCTGVLPWRGLIIGFRRAALNDLLIEGSTASTNLEDFFDGTGYVGGTAKLTVNATAISGDATAADTLELFVEALDQATGQIDNGTLGTSLDTYQADVEVIDDDTNTADRYSVTFFKNGEPVLSGITSPTIQVIKDADGTDLVASTALAEVGSLGHFRYTASSRMVDGASYKAKVQATIGGATRTWIRAIGRDS